MPEIWTISLTTHGLGACALSTTGKHRTFSASWPESRAYGLHGIASEAVRRLIAHALETLRSQATELPLAIGLCSPDRETAAFADKNREFLTPFLTDAPIELPRRDVPDKFAGDASLVQAYRQSVLRGIQVQSPTLGITEPLGLLSMGAAAALWLTGNPACTCLPLCVPDHFPAFEDLSQEAFFSALGVHPELSMKRARCGHLVGKIAPDMPGRLRATDIPGLAGLSGIPVFDMGSANAGRAYASAANPLSWSAELGTEMRAHWTSGVSALAKYELTVNDTPDAKTEASGNDTDDMTADDWTRAWHETMPLSVEPGPGTALACYGISLRSVRSRLFEHACERLYTPGTPVLDFKALKHAPLGSHGLHTLFGADGCQIVGLRNAHDDCDLARSAFEGMCYALRERRERLEHGADGPVRLLLEAPWPQACAQWAADILNADVYVITEESSVMSAFGICLALMRMLGLPPAERPSMQATIVEPGQRSAYYSRHYQVHCALRAHCSLED
ncbi:MAG: hypothetical protein IJ165_09150 [Proteobacteria bacterium]|nr:hypothetical protein [Pseudomonadota bacterium]